MAQDHAVFQRNALGLGLENFRGVAQKLAFESPAARCTDKPITTMELLALVLTSYGVTSVFNCATVTALNGIANTSATT